MSDKVYLLNAFHIVCYCSVTIFLSILGPKLACCWPGGGDQEKPQLSLHCFFIAFFTILLYRSTFGMISDNLFLLCFKFQQVKDNEILTHLSKGR